MREDCAVGRRGGGGVSPGVAAAMLSGVQPCFQLLRIGSSSSGGNANGVPESARDLYTFRPALTHSVFRLGRAPELCDVTLEAAGVSRIHAELRAERQAEAGGEEGWSVTVKDRSSHGTWVNDARLQPGVQWELSDGDTLTFGGQSECGSPEFYFLFQKVRVRPLDFDAITVPKAGSFSSDIQNRIRTSLDRRSPPSLDLSKLSINRSTVILNSIGSLSKMNASSWTFKRADKTAAASDPSPADNATPTAGFTALGPPSTPPPYPLAGVAAAISSKSVPASSKSRRKSAHTVLLEDDSSDGESGGRAGGEDGRRARGRKRRRLYKSESEVFQPPAPPALALPRAEAARRNCELKPAAAKPNGGIHALLAHHGAKVGHLTFNAKVSHLTFAAPGTKREVVDFGHRNGGGVVATAFRQQRAYLPSSRGCRRANSSPLYSPLVVGGESYSLASPSLRLCKAERERGQVTRFHVSSGKRRGRPRKQPPPRPSPPSSSSSSSSSSSGSSSSSSSSSSSDSDEAAGGAWGQAGGAEPCAAPRCRPPQQDTVQWIQCDACDAWYHQDCLRRGGKAPPLDPTADFHCGCR